MAKTTVPSVASRDRVSEAVKLLESDYPAIFAIYTKIDKIREKSGESAVMSDYRIGSLIQEVAQDKEKYKEEGQERLADALGVSNNQFYNWKQLASTWADEEEFRKLIAVRSKTHESITTQHLLVLVRVEKAADRKALHKRWRDESLSVREMAEVVEKAAGGPRGNNPNGRMGNNPLKIVNGITQVAEKLLKAADSGEIAFNAIDKNPKKHASQTLLDSIEESLVAIRNIQERVSETERLLENSKDKVAKQLEAQEKEEAEAAAKASAKAAGKGKKVKKVKVRGTAAIKTVEDESDEKPVKKVKKLLKPLKSLKKAIKTEGGKDAAASPAKSEKSKKKLSSALTGSLD